jgi:putative endonuclease
VPVVCNRAPSRQAPGLRTSRDDLERAPEADARRAVGRVGEDLADAHFQRLGFRVIDRNVRTRAGEIDLIACDGRTLVFVEVKTRRARPGARHEHAGLQPLEGLRARQRSRIRRLAVAWLCRTDHDRPAAQTVRFDAVGVTVDARGRLLRLDHLEAAW